MDMEDQNKLKSLLHQYTSLTIKLIEDIEKDEFIFLENLFEMRQNIIDEINTVNFKSSYFKSLCEENKLLPLQKKLTLLVNEKKSTLKKEINSLESSKVASKNYKKNFSIESLYFNKKI